VGINFWGVVYGCKFFLPHLKQADEAHIVNLSSVFGLLGVPAQSSYCATKFAVRGLSEALWVELKQHNIGVTAVHPAGVRTDIARSARTTQSDLKSSAVDIIERMSVSPERCATLIVRAIKRGKMRQLVAREAYLIEAAKRISPTLPQRLLQAGFSRGLGVKRG
jgi:short-subunit dehydrogenase